MRRSRPAREGPASAGGASGEPAAPSLHLIHVSKVGRYGRNGTNSAERGQKETPPVADLGGGATEGVSEASVDEKGGLADLPKRVNRLGIARRRALAFIGYLRSEGKGDTPHNPRTGEIYEPQRVADRMAGCASWLVFGHYREVDQVRLQDARFCNQHLVCPVCAILRGSRLMDRYRERYEYIVSQNPSLTPVFITLTVKNGDDLGERFQHLRSAVRVLLDRRRDFMKKGWGSTEFRHLHGLVGSFEVTKSPRHGWHPHTHIMGLSSGWIDQAALSEEWRAITGDSFIVDVRRFGVAQDPAEAFAEVFKYAVKASGMPFSDTWAAHAVLKAHRLVYSAGCFRGVQVPETLTDDPLTGLTPTLLFYRYLRGIGYSFVPHWGEDVA